MDCLRVLALSAEMYYSMSQVRAAVIFVKDETQSIEKDNWRENSGWHFSSEWWIAVFSGTAFAAALICGVVQWISILCTVKKPSFTVGLCQIYPKNQHSCFTWGITIALWLPGRFAALWTIENLFRNALSVSGIQILKHAVLFSFQNILLCTGGESRKGGGYFFYFFKVSSLRRNSISAEFHVSKGSNCGVLNVSITCWCFHGNPKVLQSPVWLLGVSPQIFLFWLPLDFPVATI